jgi:aspartate carbamoyltransferase catalytic subunit
MPSEITEKINCISNCQQIDTMQLEEAISQTDVLYMTRIQKERFDTLRNYQSVVLQHDFQNLYCINLEKMKNAKINMIVMHPFPRANEISTDMDNDNRSVYFKQMENGVYMRMAILDHILTVSK